MSPDKSQPESEGLLSRLASKITAPQVAGFALAASLANADIRTGVMNTLISPAHAEDWQDQGTTNNANADGEYIWCYGGDANGVHVRNIYDTVGGQWINQVDDGSGTYTEDLDTLIGAYDSSIDSQRTCIEDVDSNLDQIKFQNPDGDGFIVNGYLNTGAISSITYLEGSQYYTGNLYNGRAFIPDWNGGDIGAFEQFEGSSATEYYVHPSDDLVSLIVNPDTDQVFAAKTFLTGQVYKYDNASAYSGSASTESTLTGVSGEPRSWKDAADSSTGYNSFSTLKDGVVHTIADMDSGAVTDPDADGDGYAVTAGPDCDDTDADINPGADEECDGVDNNCDGSIDGTDSIDVSTWYLDKDEDGVGGTSTQEACDAPSGYVATGGDWDDNDASVQTEPTVEPGVCEEGESAEGEFKEGETICGPDGSQGTVMSGTADYTVSLATLDEDQDWVEFIGSLELGETFEDRYVFNPSENSIGGFGLGISADAMLTGLNMAPPPSEGGDSTFLTLRVDQGTVSVEDKVEGTSALVEAGDVYEVALESTEGDTGTDTGTDTGGDDTGPGDTDDTAVIDDTDTDSGNPDAPDDTGSDGDGETPKDGGQGGCNSCASTPMPNPSLVVLGLALAGTLVRRRKQ